MKARLFFLPVVCFTLFTFSMVSPCRAAVITFDDISAQAFGSPIPNGYQGLSWSTYFSCLNAVSFTGSFGLSGYYYGMVTSSNVAYNGSASPVEIDSQGTNFNFLSAYFTGAWNSNLNIEVQGYNDANLLYDQTVMAAATNPTLFAFNYLNIDRLTFNSFGGQSAGFGGSGGNFVMDNFTFEFVPEPSAVVLTGVGAVLLLVSLKRKRA